MDIRIAWGGKTRSPTHPRNFLDPGRQIQLVEDWYEGVDQRFYKDQEELAPPIRLRLFADYHRRTRVRPRSHIIELNLQTARDVVGLARYFGEWDNGARAALHDVLGIAAEIYAANAQWRAARAFSDYRRQLVRQAHFTHCVLGRPRMPNLVDYRVADDQFSECVKAFLYFHEERHYQHEVRSSSVHHETADLDCDDHARMMMEAVGEEFHIDFFVEYIDAVLFFTLLIQVIAEYAACLLDGHTIREERFAVVLQRSSRIADRVLMNDIVNRRPYPSLAQPYIDRAKVRSAKYRPQMTELLADLENAFVHITSGYPIRGCMPFSKRAPFLRLISEIQASADQDFELRKTDDWCARL